MLITVNIFRCENGIELMFQKISHLLAVHNEEFKYGTTCFIVTQWGLRVKGANETNPASC